MIKSLTNKHYKMIIARLVAERERAGVSQISLANKIGVTQSSISKIERCERRLDIYEFITICDALGIPASRIVADFEAPNDSGAA